MKYYFTDNCYWDHEVKCVYRNDNEVRITDTHKKLLGCLIENNCSIVSYDKLLKSYGVEHPTDNDTNNLWNNFYRDTEKQKGLIARVPEIAVYLERQKGAGYRLSIPKQNIQGKNNSSVIRHSRIWLTNTDFSRWQKQADETAKRIKERNMRLYLEGRYMAWPLFFYPEENTPVRRDIVDLLLTKISLDGGIYALTGAGGEGKTTVLNQACADLYKIQESVLYHKLTSEFDMNDITPEDIVFIDNADNRPQFKRFLYEAYNSGITVVFALRSNEWNILKDNLLSEYTLVARAIEEIPVKESIEMEEAQKFAKCIKRHIPDISQSTEDIATIFFQHSHGFLYASMLMVLYKCESLEEITNHMLNNIYNNDDSRQCLPILAAIVFAERCGIPVSNTLYKYLCEQESIEPWRPTYYISKEIITKNGAYFQTRHEKISDQFFKFLFRNQGSKPYISDEETVSVALRLLNYFLRFITSNPSWIFDYNSKEVRDVANIVINTMDIIDYDTDYSNYFVQRVIEDCRNNALHVIERIYIGIDNWKMQNSIAEKCLSYEPPLPTWSVYKNWISELIEMGEHNRVEQVFSTIYGVNGFPPELCIKWAQFEEEQHNIASYSDEGSSAWIYKNFCEGQLQKDGGCWIFYSRLIKSHPTLFPGETAISVLKKGCLEYDADSSVWGAWADEEERKGNIGTYNNIGGAAWILKEACTMHNASGNPGVWQKWMEFSKDNPSLSQEFTPLHIIRTACKDYNIRNSHLWRLWADAEAEQGNIGDSTEKYSALWIYRRAIENEFDNDSSIWLAWSRFFERYTSQINDDEKNYALMAMRNVCLFKGADIQTWVAWAQMSELLGIIGDYNTPETAAWIYKEICINRNDRNTLAMFSWIKFANSHPLNDGDCVINAEHLLDFACSKMEAFKNPNWTDLVDFKKSIGYKNG